MLVQPRKKSGFPLRRDYDCPLQLHSLGEIVQSLKAKYGIILIDEKSMQQKILDLISCMDVSLINSKMINIY